MPERYLKDGKLDPDPADPTDFCFGFGRRWVTSRTSYSACKH